jgi:hypothetical protein
MAVATLMIGTFGAVALAGNQVAMSVGGLLYMVPLGVAGAVAIRVAQERGAGNDAALRPIAWAALALATTWLAASAAVLGLYGRTIAGWITDEPEVIAVAAALFFVFACSNQPLSIYQSGINKAFLGFYQAFDAWLELLKFMNIATWHRTTDDKRCTRIVDEYRVHLIHHRKMVLALNKFAWRMRHVVAQVIETKLVVGAIRNIGLVGLAARR